MLDLATRGPLWRRYTTSQGEESVLTKMKLLIALIFTSFTSFSSQAINRVESPVEIIPFAFCTEQGCKVSISISNLTGHNVTLESHSSDDSSMSSAGLSIFDATKLSENYDTSDVYNTILTNNLPRIHRGVPSLLYSFKLEPWEKINREIEGVHELFTLESHGDYLLNYALPIKRLYVEGQLVEETTTFISRFTNFRGYKMPVK